jgi:hypothetical protein
VGGFARSIGGLAPELGLGAGDDVAATEAALARPELVLLDPDGSFVYTADTGNGLIHRLELATGVVRRIGGSTVPGDPEIGTPGVLPRAALTVRLRQPVAMALDSEAAALFVADKGTGQIVRIGLEGADPAGCPEGDICEVQGLDSFTSVEGLAFHRFESGARVLFVAEGGSANTQAGAAEIDDPRLFALDLDAQPPTRTALSLGIGANPDPWRKLLGIAVAPLPAADGAIELFVSIDREHRLVAARRGGFELSCENGGDDDGDGSADFDDLDCRSADRERFDVLRFEFDCHDGVDDDLDGSVDFVDDDCESTVQSRIARYRFPAASTFADLAAVAPEDTVRGFQRVAVEIGAFNDPATCANGLDDDRDGSVDFDDVDCIDRGFEDGPFGGCPASSPPDAVVAGLVHSFGAITVDARGRLFAVDTLTDTVGRVRLLPTAPVFIVLAGTAVSTALPFDGSHPLSTRLSRPRGIQVDAIDNLWIADSGSSRVRRVWIGDRVGSD